MIRLTKINQDGTKIFNDFEKGGLLVDVIYKQQLTHQYDTTTGKVTESVEEIPVRCFWLSYSKRELTNEIRASDVKCVLLKNELGVEPAMDDVVVKDEVEYRVVTFSIESHNPFMELQLRGE